LLVIEEKIKKIENLGIPQIAENYIVLDKTGYQKTLWVNHSASSIVGIKQY